MTKAWKAEGSLEARHTEANMAALREIELETLQGAGGKTNTADSNYYNMVCSIYSMCPMDEKLSLSDPNCQLLRSIYTR